MGLHRQRRRLGADDDRRRARHGLPAGGAADRRLLRRPSSRQRAVRREPRRARSEDRRAQVALPARAPRHLGHGHPVRADPRRHHRRRQDDQGDRADTKQGWVYVFDRTNGQPVWPIEERPVEKGDVPGEWYSPTQPFVTKPPAFDRQGVSLDDLIDFTPELHEEALKLVVALQDRTDLHAAGRQQGRRDRSATLMLPSATGGANWQGGALDPETNNALRLLGDGAVGARAGAAGSDEVRLRLRAGRGARPNAPPVQTADGERRSGAATAGRQAGGGGRGQAPAAGGRGQAAGGGRGGGGGGGCRCRGCRSSSRRTAASPRSI